jgi:hypothetical protein
MDRAHQTAITLWPCVDVGGTSIRLLLVAGPEHEQPFPPIRIEIPTPPGLPALAEAVRSCIREATESAAGRGYAVARALAVGTPGRIETGADGHRVIAPMSAVNLESFPGEMDCVDLAAELAQALGLSPSRVFWDNDAVVQGLYLINDLLRDSKTRNRMIGRTVVCINPGTGLGGCVADVGENSIEVFTDSHVSELLIHPVRLSASLGEIEVQALSSADGTHIEIEIRGASSSVHDSLISPETKQAEDFLAGPGLERIANLLDALCARCSPPIPCFADEGRAIDGQMLSDLISSGSDSTAARAARFVGDLGGYALARLISVLHGGATVKSAPFLDWPPAEVERIRGVTRFVLGGGISRTPLGQRMIESARDRLAHVPEVEIFVRDQVADAGALGAFSLIPPQVRRAVESSS